MSAQDKPAVRPTSATEDTAELAAQKQRAQALFERGLARIETNDWAGAAPLFAESVATFPTRVGFLNLSVCFKRLDRPSDALDVYDELARRLPAQPHSPEGLEETQARVELRALIAEVSVDSSLSGAVLSVDGRVRGTTPLAKPLRLDPGEHVLGLTKDGYEPVELRLLVAAGETRSVRAELRRSSVPESELLPVTADVSAPAEASPAAPVVVPAPARPSAFSLALLGGLSWSSSFAGDAERRCEADAAAVDGSSRACPAQRPVGPFIGLRVGYLVLPKLAVELAVGYLSLERTLQRYVEVDAQSVAYVSDDLLDEMQLEAAFVAPSVAYRTGTAWPFSAQLAFGLARGRITASDTATFTRKPDPVSSFVAERPAALELEEDAQIALIPLLAPEVRIGARLQRNVVISLGLALWLLFPADVRRSGNVWNESGLRAASLDVSDLARPRTATLPAERALGTFLIWIPSLALTWEL